MVYRADAPIVVQGAEHFVERNYREGGRYQWVRETAVNAIEAGATRVEFGTEWQGVAEHGVYRRIIADNGSGMTPDQLLAFFRTYGGSGRPIGGIHENYGIGAKCSLFPWNRAGVVVVSWHPDYDEPSMIWVRMDPSTGTYGLRTWHTADGGENVIAAGNDEELGIDWSLVGRDWVEDHGTVVTLLGNELDQDTVVGDPSRDEGGVPGVGVANYLNRRMWELDGITMTVDEYRRADKGSWPKSNAASVNAEIQLGRRRIEGAKYYVEYPPGTRKGSISDRGTLRLTGGTEIDWYLWKGLGREGIRNAAAIGYIATLYSPPDSRTCPELFDVTDHPSRFRSFGISEAEVRRRLWLIARPPLADDRAPGVYMSSDRNRLLIQGGPLAGDPLPWDEWAIEFADRLPEPIVDEINRVRVGETDSNLDESWRDRLAERFSRRWRQLRLVLDRSGDHTADPDSLSGAPRALHRPHRAVRRAASGGEGGRDGSRNMANREDGSDAARVRKTAVGLPRVEWKDGDEFQPGLFAIWNPPSVANPDGLVQLNVEHPVLREEILHWAPQYPTHLEDEVIETIQGVYAQLAAANIAHGEALRVHLERTEVLQNMRTPEALTAALLGLVGASAIIGPTLGGALGRRRQQREEARTAS